MKVAALLLLAVWSPFTWGAVRDSCAHSKGAGPDLTIHGRLAIYNGGYPNYRIWQIGSTHIYGIYEDTRDRDCLSGTPCSAAEDGPHLPPNIERLTESAHSMYWRLYGDFVIRPLSRQIPGHQQAACLLSASDLVLKVD